MVDRKCSNGVEVLPNDLDQALAKFIRNWKNNDFKICQHVFKLVGFSWLL